MLCLQSSASTYGAPSVDIGLCDNELDNKKPLDLQNFSPRIQFLFWVLCFVSFLA